MLKRISRFLFCKVCLPYNAPFWSSDINKMSKELKAIEEVDFMKQLVKIRGIRGQKVSKSPISWDSSVRHWERHCTPWGRCRISHAYLGIEYWYAADLRSSANGCGNPARNGWASKGDLPWWFSCQIHQRSQWTLVLSGGTGNRWRRCPYSRAEYSWSPTIRKCFPVSREHDLYQRYPPGALFLSLFP